MTARLAILLSGSGSTYANLVHWMRVGRLPATVGVVVASRPEVFGVERARQHGHPCRIAWRQSEVAAILAEQQVEWVVMCGWLKYFDPPPPWAGRTLNIHPSLIPSFCGQGMYGHHVHEAVLAAGCKVSGCTVHLVAGAYDSGPILAQLPVPVLADDTPQTLAGRVQSAERRLYPAVLAGCLEGRLRRSGDQAWIDGLDLERFPDPA